MSETSSPSALAIDTSGSYCSVAVRNAHGTICHCESDGAGDHFERLPGLVVRVCQQAGISVSQLGQLRVGLGPGSFTGLRIGLSFAKGLSVAHRIPLIGVSSFYGLAQSVVSRAVGSLDEFAVISDARRGEVFMSTYARVGGRAIEVIAPAILPAPEVVGWLGQRAGRKVYTPIKNFAPEAVVECTVESQIAEGFLLVEGLYELPFSVEQLALLEPNYLRAVAAKSIQERTGA